MEIPSGPFSYLYRALGWNVSSGVSEKGIHNSFLQSECENRIQKAGGIQRPVPSPPFFLCRLLLGDNSVFIMVDESYFPGTELWAALAGWAGRFSAWLLTLVNYRHSTHLFAG